MNPIHKIKNYKSTQNHNRQRQIIRTRQNVKQTSNKTMSKLKRKGGNWTGEYSWKNTVVKVVIRGYRDIFQESNQNLIKDRLFHP